MLAGRHLRNVCELGIVLGLIRFIL